MESVRRAEKRGALSQGANLLRDELLSTVPALHRLMLRWGWTSRLNDYIQQAGMTTKPGKVVLSMATVAVGTFYVMELWLENFLGALFIALVAGCAPLAYIGYKRKKRLEKFEEHFPEALDLLGRAVRAGHAFTTGLEMIATEADDPIGGEFRTTFEEQNFGLPLRDTLMNLSDRVPLIDVRFFVTSLMIQRETGGNLAEILDGLSKVIRDRFRIHRDIKTRTAQGKLTALILIAIPPLMMVLLTMLNPEYMQTLTLDPAGPTILAIAGTLQVIGSAILWRIIHIDV
ncbi:MAG TPA: type II secretion system F family protein [Verrucomicrobiae bacterium]|jgi:tight adherence protein B|nr:type II secretion system F family protein [Verrucomicrobiae bacterium]